MSKTLEAAPQPRVGDLLQCVHSDGTSHLVRCELYFVTRVTTGHWMTSLEVVSARGSGGPVLGSYESSRFRRIASAADAPSYLLFL